MSTDYKKKYVELRSKYLSAIDVSFRKGYEKGFQESQVQSQMQQAQAQQEQMAAMAQQQAQMPPQGQEGQEMSPEEQMAMEQQGQPMEEQQEQPTELDQQIEQLQGLLQKGEKPSYVALRDVTLKIAELRKAEATKRALPKLEPEQKQEIALQTKIVKDLTKKWKEESTQVAHDIANLL